MDGDWLLDVELTHIAATHNFSSCFEIIASISLHLPLCLHYCHLGALFDSNDHQTIVVMVANHGFGR